MQQRIYLAGPYERRTFLREEIAPRLREMGHHITSSWINDPEENEKVSDYLRARRQGDVPVNLEYEAILAHEAQRDEMDVTYSTMLMRFPNPNGSISGGRFHEMGFASASGLQLVVVGKRESVFDYMPRVAVCSDFTSAMYGLRLT